jgi:U4/U6.U5 tri-snRNP-associated protein 1
LTLTLLPFRAVPQATEFLDAPLTKKSSKAKKKDVTKKEHVSDITGFTTNSSLPVLGADTTVPVPSGASGAVISGEPTVAMSAPGSPAPRSGFTRIGGDLSAAGSASGTPAPEDRGKVQFGFSAIGKRKAEDDHSGPTPKRR